MSLPRPRQKRRPANRALFDAALEWNAAEVRALLAAGADLEASVTKHDDGDFRATPLWYAVARGENPPLVRDLLKRGAVGSHALWATVFRNDAAMLRLLLRAKVRVDVYAEGESPIFLAARLQRLETLALLIEACADPSVRDARGRDAVEIARAR